LCGINDSYKGEHNHNYSWDKDDYIYMRELYFRVWATKSKYTWNNIFTFWIKKIKRNRKSKRKKEKKRNEKKTA
jgi:hypothetical protein